MKKSKHLVKISTLFYLFLILDSVKEVKILCFKKCLCYSNHGVTAKEKFFNKTFVDKLIFKNPKTYHVLN